MKKNISFLIYVFSFLLACTIAQKPGYSLQHINPYQYSVRKKIICENGAVVSAHPIASKVGVEMLKLRGNAFDAAIAVQLALAVVYPNAGNIGGGGFMVARLSDAAQTYGKGKLIALDFREVAPADAHRDMYLDAAGNAQTEKSQNGHLSSGVPGTIAGLFAMMQYAKLPFEKLIQPAIDLAEKGYCITEAEANSFNNIQNDLRKYNTVIPVFVKQILWKAGDTLIQTDLANTLKRIRDNGQAGFYEGETAKFIVDEMKRGGGIVSYNDLKNYKATWREPHIFDYKGYTIAGMPMPSSGGVLLNQMLKMIESRSLGSAGFQSPQAVQLMTEVERRAFADRAEFMGDADFYKVPVAKLVSDDYLKDRMKDYDSLTAGNSKNVQP
ncbi:MAG: gamma-glutamyltransferase, partial [Bacteroidota bacterium]|nr:gamma-glutamyltransferase [Bacteroidota bacterium]